MSKSPASPKYSDGAPLRRYSKRFKLYAAEPRPDLDSVLPTFVPLQEDWDRDFVFEVKTKVPGGDGTLRIGLHLKDYMDNVDGSPNPTIMATVDQAAKKIADEKITDEKITDEKIIDEKMHPGDPLVVQRAYFPGEGAHPPSRPVGDMPRDMTFGHLLSLIVREQYNATLEGKWPLKMVGDHWDGGLPPYEHMWIIAIRKTKKVNGTVRWFPQIEVRIPLRAEGL